MIKRNIPKKFIRLRNLFDQTYLLYDNLMFYDPGEALQVFSDGVIEGEYKYGSEFEQYLIYQASNNLSCDEYTIGGDHKSIFEQPVDSYAFNCFADDRYDEIEYNEDYHDTIIPVLVKKGYSRSKSVYRDRHVQKLLIKRIKDIKEWVESQRMVNYPNYIPKTSRTFSIKYEDQIIIGLVLSNGLFYIWDEVKHSELDQLKHEIYSNTGPPHFLANYQKSACSISFNETEEVR